ncbi:MAG: hypothetical protein Q9202_006049 [Teloschistes flavicans]
MSVRSLNARLQPLFDAHRQTVHLTQRLSKTPATSTSNSSDPDAINAPLELSAEIHQSLKEQEEEFELLRQEIEDHTSWTAAAKRRNNEKERERTDLAAQVARLGEDLKIARSQFRKAQLQAKRHAEVAKQKERELLFAGVQEGTFGTGQGRRKGQEQLLKDQLELNASADVTAALRRVHSLMQSEVSRSQFALETLRTTTTIAGALGAKNQRVVTNSASHPVPSAPLEQLSPTGKLPTFQSGMSAPSIHVGGGGKGRPPPRRDEDTSMLEKVGEMVGKTSEAASSSHPTQSSSVQETILRERESDEPPNPKKRMWEEDTSGTGDTRVKDEL